MSRIVDAESGNRTMRHEATPTRYFAPGFAPVVGRESQTKGGGTLETAHRIALRADQAHQRHSWIAFPVAVVKKFGDDQAGNLAALVAYYGFFSLFPLMLVFVTILGMALHGNPDLQQRIQESALADFPVIGNQIRQDVHSLNGSATALALGIALALWAGLGVLRVMQTAMNTVWNVPYRRRPNFFVSIL